MQMLLWSEVVKGFEIYPFLTSKSPDVHLRGQATPIENSYLHVNSLVRTAAMEALKLLETTETMMIPSPVVFFYAP